MLKVEGKGIIHSVAPVEMGQKEGSKMYKKVMILIPGYTDAFGEKKGDDAVHEFVFFAEKAEALPKDLKPGDRVEFVGRLNAAWKKAKPEDEKEFYNPWISGQTLKLWIDAQSKA